jgi:hypothetical protein
VSESIRLCRKSSGAYATSYLSPGVKRQRHEGYYWHPTSGEVKEMLISMCTPPYVLMT